MRALSLTAALSSSVISLGCPAANVGWSFAIDTTLLANGPHAVEATATTAGGINLTTSKAFTVSN